ncbi:MAG: TetR/AcrR family transcriptional regulator [Halioglobus sp.]|nr:TetR/AcrR family transcriptional regulator [Halioglobus sp.]
MNTANHQELSVPAEQLLIAAERLLAEKGLGAVSVREIARAAGQKNHSAIAYHFGSIDHLIDAILNYRMVPLNQKRANRLAVWREAGQPDDLRGLVTVLVEPFADELLQPLQQSYYLRLLAQLMSQREWQPLFSEHPVRASAALETGALIADILRPQLGDEIALERMRLMGLHLLNTITEWDAVRRRGDFALDPQTLAWRVDNLISYLVGGLSAP